MPVPRCTSTNPDAGRCAACTGHAGPHRFGSYRWHDLVLDDSPVAVLDRVDGLLADASATLGEFDRYDLSSGDVGQLRDTITAAITVVSEVRGRVLNADHIAELWPDDEDDEPDFATEADA